MVKTPVKKATRPYKKRAVKPEAAAEPKEPEIHKPKPIKVPSIPHVYAVGKRKTAVSQVTISSGTGVITINELPFESYFQTLDLRHIASQPLVALGVEKTLNIRGKIHGGGIHSQAESMRHAIARALIEVNPESRRVLKKQGMLTRDPRVKERKKPGLKRARRAPQFSKR